MEKKIWVCTETHYPVFFADEEAARLDYRKWCKHEGEEFDEELFKQCYHPLEEAYDIWTVKDVHHDGPFTLD